MPFIDNYLARCDLANPQWKRHHNYPLIAIEVYPSAGELDIISIMEQLRALTKVTSYTTFISQSGEIGIAKYLLAKVMYQYRVVNKLRGRSASLIHLLVVIMLLAILGIYLPWYFTQPYHVEFTATTFKDYSKNLQMPSAQLKTTKKAVAIKQSGEVTLALETTGEASQDPTETPPQEIPVLLYHHILDDPGNSLAVSPAVFEQHMKYLSENGYHGITLNMLYLNLTRGTPLPDKPVLITFDDGWKSQYLNAIPVLYKYKFPAAFFIYGQAVTYNSKDLMNVADIIDLKTHGYDVASHSWSHPSLMRKPGEPFAVYKERMALELKHSKEWLESKIGETVDSFAYPYGLYDSWAAKAVSDAGYKLAFTVNSGANLCGSQSNLLLKRVIVFQKSSISEIARKLQSKQFKVLSKYPEDASFVTTNATKITATLYGLNDVATPTIHFALDHKMLPTSWALSVDGKKAYITSQADLTPGFHFLSIRGKTKNGSIVDSSWAFSMGGNGVGSLNP